MYSLGFMTMLLPLILIAGLWSLFWKGTALWRAARNGDGIWFIIMLLVNTLGILEIIYLFGVAKVSADKLFKK
jgi:methionyl-tRNA synthetase